MELVKDPLFYVFVVVLPVCTMVTFWIVCLLCRKRCKNGPPPVLLTHDASETGAFDRDGLNNLDRSPGPGGGEMKAKVAIFEGRMKDPCAIRKEGISRLLSQLEDVDECVCAICLDPLFSARDQETEDVSQNEAVLAFLTQCHHKFHFECLWDWVLIKKVCPTCRTSTSTSDTDIQAIVASVLLTLANNFTNPPPPEGHDVEAGDASDVTYDGGSWERPSAVSETAEGRAQLPPSSDAHGKVLMGDTYRLPSLSISDEQEALLDQHPPASQTQHDHPSHHSPV